MQNLIFLAEGTESTEGGHAPENPLGFVPVEFALSLVVFGLLLFLIWKFVAPRFEQTFAERPGMQTMRIPPVATKTLSITFNVVTPPGSGDLGRDYTAISEVSIIGQRAG